MADRELPVPKRRKPAALPFALEPLLVSHKNAAFLLGQISERTLDQLVAEGRLKARQITPGRIGYLYRELVEFAERTPILAPGVAQSAGMEEERRGNLPLG